MQNEVVGILTLGVVQREVQVLGVHGAEVLLSEDIREVLGIGDDGCYGSFLGLTLFFLFLTLFFLFLTLFFLFFPFVLFFLTLFLVHFGHATGRALFYFFYFFLVEFGQVTEVEFFEVECFQPEVFLFFRTHLAHHLSVVFFREVSTIHTVRLHSFFAGHALLLHHSGTAISAAFLFR